MERNVGRGTRGHRIDPPAAVPSTPTPAYLSYSESASISHARLASIRRRRGSSSRRTSAVPLCWSIDIGGGPSHKITVLVLYKRLKIPIAQATESVRVERRHPMLRHVTLGRVLPSLAVLLCVVAASPPAPPAAVDPESGKLLFVDKAVRSTLLPCSTRDSKPLNVLVSRLRAILSSEANVVGRSRYWQRATTDLPWRCIRRRSWGQS